MRQHGTWIGFLAMAFVVVGLAGLLACYALPIPLDRALARIATLDGGGDGTRETRPVDARIVDALGEADAGPILHGGGDDRARLDAAARAILRQAAVEQDATAVRLRWLVVMATITGAAFGAAILGVAGRGPRGRETDAASPRESANSG